MKLTSKKIMSVGIMLALIAFAVWYLIDNYDEFMQLEFVSPWLLVVLGGLLLLNYYFIGVITNVLLWPLGVRLGRKEAYQLSLVTGFYNLITPFKGGMAARAVYLKKKYKFTYTDFIASLGASYVLIFLVASLLGILSAAWIYLRHEVFSPAVFMIFLAMFLGMAFIILFSPRLRDRENNLVNRFIKVINGWHLIKNNKKVVWVTTVLSLLQLLVTALMLYLQFTVFGIEVGYAEVLFLASISALSILIAVTPAGLGITEAIVVFSALTIGITPAESLAASLLGRLVSVIVLFVLGPIFSYTLLKKNGRNEKG